MIRIMYIMTNSHIWERIAARLAFMSPHLAISPIFHEFAGLRVLLKVEAMPRKERTLAQCGARRARRQIRQPHNERS